jgi:hypothetical protein
MLLAHQQNKKRLLMARQEQDSMSGLHQQGQGQFPPAVSPFGTRPGLSPNPADTKGRKSKLGHQGLPGSPMPDSVLQQQRGSSAPNMNFPDPILAPPGGLPFIQRFPSNVKPPPISHPISNFYGQQPTPQQVEALRNDLKNGQRRGVPPKPGMPQQIIQDQMLAHPGPSRGQKLLEQNHAPPMQAQMEAEAQKRRDIEANRQQAEAQKRQQQLLKQQAAHQQQMRQMQRVRQMQQARLEQQVRQMQQARREQAGQQPGQQLQNTTAMLPQGSQSSMGNQQGAGLANMTPNQTSETAPRKKGTKSKKVQLRAPHSSPSSADADPRSP